MEKYLDSNGVLRLLQGVKTQIEGLIQKKVLNTKGAAEGIASLDRNGYVPLSQLGNLDTTLFEIVQTLPTAGIMKHIYLLRNGEHANGNDLYTEYIYTGDVTAEYNAENWEELGSFAPEFDLADYVKNTAAVKAGSLKFTSSDSKTSLNLYYTDSKDSDATPRTVEIPVVKGGNNEEGTVGTNGLMSSTDKVKLDAIDLNALEASINNANTAAANTNEAIKNAEKATAEAEAVNAELTDDNVFKVTDRHSNVKTLQLYDQAAINTELAGIKGKTDEEEGVDTSKVNLRTLSESLHATSAEVKDIIGNTDDAEDNIDTKDVNLKSISKDVASIQSSIGTAETEGTILKSIADNASDIAGNSTSITAILGGEDNKVDTDKVNLKTLSDDVSAIVGGENVDTTETNLSSLSSSVSALQTAVGDDKGGIKKDIADINETKVDKKIIKTKINDSDEEVPTSKAVKAGLDAVNQKVDGLTIPKIVSMTEENYDALESKDSDTYYMLYEEE
jgi:hypothetical protein